MIKQVQVYFGGTFDPFHHGHLSVAKHVIEQLNVEKITLLPANIPPHKAHAKVTSSHRLAMLEALIKDEPWLTIDARELARDKPSYTYETLKDLKQSLPRSTLNFVIGMDSLLNFTQWYQWQEIIKLTNLIVCTRPNYELGKHNHALDTQLRRFITSAEEFDLTLTGQITVLPAIAYDISSTHIRQALTSGKSDLNSLLPTAISNYINANQLYRE